MTYLAAGITGLSIQNVEFVHNVLIRGAELKDPAGRIRAGPSIGIAYSIQGESTGPIAGIRRELRTAQDRVLIQSILQQHFTTDHTYHRPAC
jgi:hypothetical protein